MVKRKTLIAITHRNTILRVATRVLVIDKRVIVADDSPEKLMNQKSA